MSSTYRAALRGGDEITVVVKINNGVIVSSQWRVVGRESLVEAVRQWKPTFQGSLTDLKVPTGTSLETLLLRQLVMKVKGTWGEQPSDPELCHCRKISQENVERAIILGAHTVEKVRQRTSANTGCGTCLPDIEDLLKKYLEPILLC